MGTHIFTALCARSLQHKVNTSHLKANRRDFPQYIEAKAEFQKLCDAFRFLHESPTREQIRLSQTWPGQSFTLTPKLLRNKLTKLGQSIKNMALRKSTRPEEGVEQITKNQSSVNLARQYPK